MSRSKRALIAGLAAGLALSGTAFAADDAAKTESSRAAKSSMKHKSAQKIIENWPEAAKSAARVAIDKYGQPEFVSDTQLVWNNNGPWKRTVVFKEETEHLFPVRHKDVLLQTINYKVPVEQFDDLAQFDGSLIIDRTKGELSSRCDKEESNFLALNVANDILTGKRTVEEARRFMADTMAASMAGRTSEYTQKLLFAVSNAGTSDPGETLLKEGESAPLTPAPVPEQTPEMPGPDRGY